MEISYYSVCSSIVLNSGTWPHLVTKEAGRQSSCALGKGTGLCLNSVDSSSKQLTKHINPCVCISCKYIVQTVLLI